MASADEALVRTADIAGHLAILCRESAEVHDVPEIKAWLKDISEMLSRLRRRLTSVSNSHAVAFVGLSNVGKSTLLNALLEADLAPRHNGPCTPVAVEYRYGSRYTIKCFPSDGQASPQLDSAQATRDFLRETLPKAKWFSPTLPPRVKITAPIPMLESGLTIIDTPGFGAAQSKTDVSHDSALRGFLARAQALVVWVVNGQQGITAAERHFHDDHLREICDTVVVTTYEDATELEKRRFSDKYIRELGRPSLTFRFVSGAQALQAAAANDADLLVRSGVSDFRRRLGTLTDRRSVAGTALQTMLNIVSDLVSAAPGLGIRRALWREDSWHRWQAMTAGFPETAEFDRQLREGVHS
jgi:GTP-binding protein EngB required for normal cell division